MRNRFQIGWQLASSAVLLLTSMAFVLSPTAASMVGDTEPCVASNGQTLDSTYGTSGAIISPDCNRIRPGERWSPSAPLVMNTSFEAVPPGFSTDAATPLGDLRNKLKSVTYRVDPDVEPLAYERSFAVGNRLWAGHLPEAPGQPAGLFAVNTLNVALLDPLPAGRHYVEVYWNLVAPYCDGLADNAAANCLPAGQTLIRRMHFYVVP
jgi:hypothetical protein